MLGNLSTIGHAIIGQLAQFIKIGPYNFNSFDTLVLVILLISLLYAASRGFMREVISLLSLLVAAMVTLFVWGQYRFTMQGFISPSWLADAVLVIGVGMISYLILLMIMSKVGKAIAGKESGFADRVLGAAFGVLRGLIISALGVMALTAQHRASLEAQEFRQSIEASNIPIEVIEKMPKSMREQMEAEVKPLPVMLENSTFFPLLNRIGDAIRALPFAKMRSYADRIKDGEFSELTDELTRQEP